MSEQKRVASLVRPGSALDAEFSGSSWVLQENPGVTARGSSSGTDRSQTQAAPAPALGKQEAGPFFARPFLHPGHPLTEEMCASAVLREAGFVLIYAMPAHRTPASKPPRGTFTPPCRVILAGIIILPQNMSESLLSLV